MIRAPRAVVLHPVRPAPWGVSLKQHANLIFDALLYKKHPELYRYKIRPWPPLSYYASVLAALVAFCAWLTDARAIAIVALAVWLALTFALFAKRLAGTSRQPSHVLEMIVTSIAIPCVAVFWRLAGAVRWRVLFA